VRVQPFAVMRQLRQGDRRSRKGGGVGLEEETNSENRKKRELDPGRDRGAPQERRGRKTPHEKTGGIREFLDRDGKLQKREKKGKRKHAARNIIPVYSQDRKRGVTDTVTNLGEPPSLPKKREKESDGGERGEGGGGNTSDKGKRGLNDCIHIEECRASGAVALLGRKARSKRRLDTTTHVKRVEEGSECGNPHALKRKWKGCALTKGLIFQKRKSQKSHRLRGKPDAKVGKGEAS